MSITLTYNGTTANLGDRLHWADEFDWSPVEQSTTYSTTGRLLVDLSTKLSGQPITLGGADTNAWITRALCSTLSNWASLPGVQFELVLRGAVHKVLFDHAKGGFTAQPVWKIQDSQIMAVMDGQVEAELLYRPTFRFLKV